MIKALLLSLLFTGALMSSSLPKHYQHTLANGMEIVAIPLKGHSGVITSDIYYKVGSKDEIMGKSGIAHMLEHMSFKSTQKLKAGEFDVIVKGHGGVNNAATGFDYTHYFIKTANQNLDMTLELFSELMDGLALKDEEFQTERDVVAEERRLRTDDDPMGYLFFRLFNTHYVRSSYHWTPIGFSEDIKSWDIEDIRSFYKLHYRPNNAILVVAGDIEPNLLFKSAQKHFGNKSNPSAPWHPICDEPKIDGFKTLTLTKADNQANYIALAFDLPAFDHDDHTALSILGDLLNHGKSSLLQSELVDKQQLFSHIHCYDFELKHGGLFIFIGQLSPQTKIEEGKKGLFALIEKIKKDPFESKELLKIKNGEKFSFLRTLESSQEIASIYGEYLAKGNLKPLLDYEDKLDKISTKEIQEVAQKYLQKNRATLVVLEKSHQQEDKK